MFKIERKELSRVAPFIPQIIARPPEPDPEIQTDEATPEQVSAVNTEEVRAEAIAHARDAVAQMYAEARVQIDAEREEAANEARRIVDSANVQARETIAAAVAEADETREWARREGFAEGRRIAEDELTVRLGEQTEAFTRLLSEVNAARETAYAEMDGEIRGLILAAVKKIINLAGESDDTIFEHLVKNAIETLRPQNQLTLRVSPADYDRCFPHGTHTFVLETGTVVTVSVVRDKTLGEWDCVLDDGEVSVDAGLDAQIAHVKLAFEQATGYMGDE